MVSVLISLNCAAVLAMLGCNEYHPSLDIGDKVLSLENDFSVLSVHIMAQSFDYCHGLLTEGIQSIVY